MADRNALPDPGETPEDVAALYSWANLHGAKYRDFSASRAQIRERARQRVQEAIEIERRRAREEAEALRSAEAQRAAEAAIMPEAARKQEPAARGQTQIAEAAQPRAGQARCPQGSFAPASPNHPQQLQLQQPGSGYAHPRAANQPTYGPLSSPPAYAPSAGQPPDSTPASQVPYVQPNDQYAASPAREEQFRGRDDHYLQARNPWAAAESGEPAASPAWLSDQADAPGQPVPAAPEDTLQGLRDRLTSRWFALQGLFGAAGTPAEAMPAPTVKQAPVLAVFSLAGGVGKTSLVATLGRALSARGERVLLVDTAAFGLLPFFFGARDQRPGVLRTFTAPGNGDAPIQVITVDPETLGPESAPQETLTQEISRHACGVSRILVDLATASGATTRRVLRLAPTVLVPVVPDMNSVISVSSIDAFFRQNVSATGQPVRPYYVLNQFDSSLPLHLDVREVLREQLGDQLLPFALRRTAAMSEALAEGMTVVDYAPDSNVAEDFGSLAAWVKSLEAPAAAGYRGVRWSER